MALVIEPIQLSGEDENVVASVLDGWINEALPARARMERAWREDLRAYEGRPRNEAKNWPWEGACLSRDTEILTRDGWTRIDWVNVGDTVLTRRDSDGVLEWNPVEAVHTARPGELYRFESRTVNQHVTGNHQMIVHRAWSGKTVRMRADELYKRTGVGRKVPLTGTWEGKDPEELFGLDPGDVAELLGWFVSEGSVGVVKGGYSSLVICQSRSVHPVECGWIEALLVRLGISFKVDPAETRYTLHQRSMPAGLVELLRKQGKAHEKYVPDFLYDFSPQLIWRFLRSLLYGDGTIYIPKGGTKLALTLPTTSIALADGVQILAQLVGGRASIRLARRTKKRAWDRHAVYIVRLLHGKFGDYSNARAGRVPYDDTAFCVTVRNHSVYVRREGVASWTGNSNLEIPMKAIVTDAILARLHNSIFGHEKIWRALVEDPEGVDDARDMEDFLTFEAANRIRLKDQVKPWELEAILLGTAWMKGFWLDDREVNYIAVEDDRSIATEVQHHYGPYLEAIPIEDVLVPPGTREVNGPHHVRCQWVDHISSALRWDQLKDREQHGYQHLDKIENHAYADWGIEIKEERDRVQGIERIRREGFDVHEVHCRFPVYELAKFPRRTVMTPNGRVERKYVELIISYHMHSRTILRVVENWSRLGWRPFFPLRYMRRGHSVYGLGVGRMIHFLNDGLNTVHNQRVDNATVANTRIWAARKGAIPRGTMISPSKILWMDDPEKDIIGKQIGDVYPSAMENELAIRDYIERRTGVVDYSLGKESPAGKYSATATSTTLLLQEGSRKFDFTLDDWRGDYGDIATWLLSMYKQFGYAYTGILELEFGVERAQRIIKVLEEQSDSPALGVYKFDLVATTASSSKEAELQQNQVLFDLTERFYIQILGLVGMATRGVDEAGVPITEAQKVVIYEAVEAGMALYRRILHTMDIKDVDRYMPDSGAIEGALRAGSEPQRPPGPEVPPGVGGGAPAPPGANGRAGAAPSFPVPAGPGAGGA